MSANVFNGSDMLPCMDHHLRDMIAYTPGSIVSKVLEKERFNITLFCMAAGTDISEHTASKPATVHVIEGKGTFTLDGKKIAMNPGTLIVMGAGAKHALEAQENT